MKSAGFDRAVALLRTTQLADGHNDLPWALRAIAGPDPAAAVGSTDLTVAQPGLHTDLPRLRRGGVGLQFWSVYVPCQFEGHSAVTAVLEQIEIVYRLAERYPGDLTIATTADEAEEAFRAGRIASMLGAEGGHCIAGSLGVLAALRRLGVRYMTLTHNLNTPWADSATDDPVHNGLTDFGREVVREMNRIGMMVDLSHVAPATMRDAIETSQAPVVFTHSSCRAVNDHPRNVPDDVLESLPANGGVCMITFVPRFVSPALAEWDEALQNAMGAEGLDHRDLEVRGKFAERWDGPPEPVATLDEVVAHVEHAREVAGIDHIGIGGDYDGVGSLPVGLEDVSTYPVLFGALLDRGWSEEDCAKLAGRNALRVLRATEEAAER
ncbi:dipeptidase [Kibdelosporangium persicum]|uniref:Membrane dipeptidase n=1 Tax=Kibdelosporangium persicum TaxID=2698649 RepID=A0ABX2FAS7_9PSEU|nr:dipeptidase [Kibdelosporangium persicum]NRN68483.1 Membrane dipeptidase [Kibdelosporangium persicum]